MAFKNINVGRLYNELQHVSAKIWQKLLLFHLIYFSK